MFSTYPGDQFAVRPVKARARWRAIGLTASSVDCCGHTPAVSAGTAFERRFIGCMVAKSLILFTLCNFTHLRMKVLVRRKLSDAQLRR